MHTIKIQPHSIIFTVGPSNCGKSYWVENFLIPALQAQTAAVGYRAKILRLSTDDIRREILGEDLGKWDPKMMYISKAAFSTLWHRLDTYTQWPVNYDFIIIDSTALHDDFYKNLNEIAERNNYHVHPIIFNYPKNQDYFRNPQEDSQGKWVIQQHVKKLKTRVLPNFTKLGIKQHTRIQNLHFENYEIQVDRNQLEILKNAQLDPDQEYVIIGDVHGCYTELVQLLQRFEIRVEDGKIVENAKNLKILLLGDWTDKGKEIFEVVDLLYNNQEHFVLVWGNHENWVYKALRGEIKQDQQFQDLLVNFDSFLLFKDNEEYRTKFMELCERSIYFAQHRDFIVTHAPCLNKYLGKADKKSIKHQQTFYYERAKNFQSAAEFQEHLNATFKFVKDEAHFSMPRHISGHVALKKYYEHANKVMLDTGCVSGGKLTGVIVNPNRRNFFQSVNSTYLMDGEKKLFLLFQTDVPDVDLYSLETDEISRIRFLALNKVNFISGTMAPSDKDKIDHEIESVRTALGYYQMAGVRKLHLQPKYMGSRCNVYLFDEVEKSYAVSRNGYMMRHLDLMPEFQRLRRKLNSEFETNNLELMILDAELLPWRAMGKHLIDDLYLVKAQAVESELQLLDETGFWQHLNHLDYQFKSSEFAEDIKKLSKKQMIDKYKNHVYSKYKTYQEYQSEHIAKDVRERGLKIFKEQIDLFGKDDVLEIKPFAILKTCSKDGNEELHGDYETNEQMFNIVSEPQELRLTIDLDNEEDVARAFEFWERITEHEEMEGIVVKPNQIYVPGVAPYMKVRNARYLTLIYGHDYQDPNKFDKLFERKSITNKLRTSIKEFELGLKMLEIPYNNINIENQDYLNICGAMVLETRKEEDLDPRL